jgi:chitinase
LKLNRVSQHEINKENRFNLSICLEKIVCQWHADLSSTKINVNFCTHFTYCYLGVDQNGELTYLNRDVAVVPRNLQQATQMRKINPKLKILASIGGWNESLLYTWSNLAADSTARYNFARNIFNFIQRFNLSGINIDWEFPNFKDDRKEDKQNFVLLLQVIKDRLGSNFTLSITIGAGAWLTNISYDVKAMFGNVNFVNLMGYRMHGAWESKTGLHSALYRGPQDNTTSNVNEAVKLLLSFRVSKMKIIVGIPTFGYVFNLTSNDNGIGAPASASSSTEIPYKDICQRVQSKELMYRFEEKQKAPYAFKGNLWVGYDDVRSVTEKANYIKKNGLGGAMISAIDNDDYDGICGEGKFPLISTVFRIIVGNSSSSTKT